MELVVGMTIMSIFMGMFTGTVVMMNRVENKTESVSITASQLNQAYLVLDKTVRYATAISPPCGGSTGQPAVAYPPGCTGTPSGDWYVELRNVTTNSEICTQFWLNSALHILERRSWNVAAGAASSVSVWSAVTSDITNLTTEPPFALASQTPTVPYQQLKFALKSVSGSGSTQTTTQSLFTFSAVSSAIPPPSAPCQVPTSGGAAWATWGRP